MAQAETGTAHVEDVINKVVNKIAEVEGVDPLELTPPLYEVIDPDALCQILATTSTAGRMNGQVTFSYTGYEVVVGGDGSVSVEKREE